MKNEESKGAKNKRVEGAPEEQQRKKRGILRLLMEQWGEDVDLGAETTSTNYVDDCPALGNPASTSSSPSPAKVDSPLLGILRPAV